MIPTASNTFSIAGGWHDWMSANGARGVSVSTQHIDGDTVSQPYMRTDFHSKRQDTFAGNFADMRQDYAKAVRLDWHAINLRIKCGQNGIRLLHNFNNATP